MASAPRLRAAGVGGDQICVHWLMATPQYAIPQPGSAWAMTAKALADSRYQKEWSRATPRSKGFCRGGAQETGNVTWPIFSPGGGTTWAESGASPRKKTTTRSGTTTRIAVSLGMTILLGNRRS